VEGWTDRLEGAPAAFTVRRSVFTGASQWGDRFLRGVAGKIVYLDLPFELGG
jgi:hypothetical protein